MYQEIFEQIGLSPNEARIYEAFLEHGESGVSDIAVVAKVHRRNAYDAIERLINKGLIFQIFSTGENKYNAVSPDKLLELVAEKENLLQKILPELRRKFGDRFAPEEAYIYRGLEGQKNIFRDVIRVGQDSYFIGAKGGWFDSRLKSASEKFFKEANRKNITFFQLFDYIVKDRVADFPEYFPGKLKYRFLPKEYTTDSAIHIFGDYVVTYTGMSIKKLEDNVVFFVIHSAHLAKSYRTWFKYIWDQSSPDSGRIGKTRK